MTTQRRIIEQMTDDPQGETPAQCIARLNRIYGDYVYHEQQEQEQRRHDERDYERDDERDYERTDALVDESLALARKVGLILKKRKYNRGKANYRKNGGAALNENEPERDAFTVILRGD